MRHIRRDITGDIEGDIPADFMPGSGACFSVDIMASIAASIVAGQRVGVRLGVILPWVHVALIAKIKERLPVDQDRGPWLAALIAAFNSARAGKFLGRHTGRDRIVTVKEIKYGKETTEAASSG